MDDDYLLKSDRVEMDMNYVCSCEWMFGGLCVFVWECLCVWVYAYVIVNGWIVIVASGTNEIVFSRCIVQIQL